MPWKKPVVMEAEAVPPRAVSGRRYKALMPWRFHPGFVRHQEDKKPVASSAPPRRGPGRPWGSKSAKGGGMSTGGLRGGTRSATAKGSKGLKLENGARPTSAEKDCQLKAAAHILLVDCPDGGKMENGARPTSADKKDLQLETGTPIVILDGPDEGKMENGARRGGTEKHCQLKKGTHIEILESSDEDEGGTEKGARSGAKKDDPAKRATWSATAKSSSGEKMEENDAPNGAEMDSESKRLTHSAAAKSSGGEKMENGSSSGAERGCKSKSGTHSATLKSSDGVTENGIQSGAEMDCRLGKSSGSIMGGAVGTAAGGDCGLEGFNSNGVAGTAAGGACLPEGIGSNAGAAAGGDCGLEGFNSNGVASTTAGGACLPEEGIGSNADAAAGGDCGLEGFNSNGAVGTAAGGACVPEGIGSNAGCAIGGDCGVEVFNSNGVVGTASGGACVPEGIGSNAGAKSSVSEGLKKSCVNESGKSSCSSAADLVVEEPEGNGGSMGNRVAKKCKFAAKLGHVGIGNVTYCRKGRKELVPWRFKIGYKRSFAKAFCSDSGSLETQECRAQGSSTQCTPGTRSTVRCYASPRSSIRVSAVRHSSSGKGEKETRTAHKKLKTENADHTQGVLENGVSLARETVMRSLQNFRLIYQTVLDEPEHRAKEAPDLQAYKIFRDRFFAQGDDKRYVGNVPGIHVGDIFYVRVELCVVGLHRPHRMGIDHIKEEDGTCLAISIVAYAHFSDVKKNLDVLVYSGSLTTTTSRKIDGTNLALKKSMDTNTPVRVIHGFSTHIKGNSQRKKMLIYGGLYLVEKYWRQKESDDRYVYMFRLRRVAGQKHVDFEEILKSGLAEPYDGVIMKDLSCGQEKIPIPVVNSISDERPMPYEYMSRLQYPHNYQPAPPAGCTCVGGCSYSKRCACAVKNGGEIPFNDKGRIIVAKPLVYECGPSCMCPPTCQNRVGQKGMKFRLQVFKTESMGWGVKTLDFIPSGSFVCEYIGEVLYDEEAQKRMTDEYLFAIGHNYYDETLWEGLSRSIPSLQKGPEEDEDAGFAVDASKMGNFAKFINHSCTPNLYAQNVLYDHDDKSAPHIMFFACEDIPPCQELAYHYNYAIDQVYDANGNIKKKKCLCGSSECDGWLY